MMTENMQTDKSALSLILYPYQFDTLTNEDWSELELARLEQCFPLDKLIAIDEQIENYFNKRDIDLMKVLPSINKTVSEKELMLSQISKGIKILLKNKTN